MSLSDITPFPNGETIPALTPHFYAAICPYRETTPLLLICTSPPSSPSTPSTSFLSPSSSFYSSFTSLSNSFKLHHQTPSFQPSHPSSIYPSDPTHLSRNFTVFSILVSYTVYRNYHIGKLFSVD